MPTKLGNGGNGQESYNPNDGKYMSQGESAFQQQMGISNNGKRKQLPTFRMPIPGETEAQYFAKFRLNAIDSIMKETGYNGEEAAKAYSAFDNYFRGDYSQFVNGNMQEETATIDDALSRMGAYDGTIYRGISFSGLQGEDDEQYYGFLNKVLSGKPFSLSRSENCLSSWTSDKNVGKSFANLDIYFKNSIILVCKNNKSAVGVEHISGLGEDEGEVLAPSKCKYKFVSHDYRFKQMSTKYRIHVIVVEEVE